jgi:hypothetical protein
MPSKRWLDTSAEESSVDARDEHGEMIVLLLLPLPFVAVILSLCVRLSVEAHVARFRLAQVYYSAWLHNFATRIRVGLSRRLGPQSPFQRLAKCRILFHPCVSLILPSVILLLVLSLVGGFIFV